MGWHLYLRENKAFETNRDGGWGWIRDVRQQPVTDFLSSIGITITGDGTCNYDGIAQLASRYPIKGSRVGGTIRGCIEVEAELAGQTLLQITEPEDAGDYNDTMGSCT